MKGSVSARFASCFGLLLLCSLLGACASSGQIEESRSFGDGEGRACLAKLSRTSAHAPAVSEAVSCDQNPKQCSAEASPCFELSVADQAGGYTLRNCPACCLGTASSFISPDCSAVVCKTDADCVFGLSQCNSGACVCPGGVCE